MQPEYYSYVGPEYSHPFWLSVDFPVPLDQADETRSQISDDTDPFVV